MQNDTLNPFEGKTLVELKVLLQLKLQQQTILYKFVNGCQLDAIQLKLYSGADSNRVDLLSFTNVLGIPPEVSPLLEALFNRISAEVIMVETAIESYCYE